MKLLARAAGFLWRNIASPLLKVNLTLNNIKIGIGPVFYGAPIIERAPRSTIHIGDKAVITSISKFTALGVCRKNIIRTIDPGAEISIGNNVGMSGSVICCSKKISIGNGCLLGSNVLIADTDFHPIDKLNRRYAKPNPGKEIIIEDNVFIGTGSIILKGVRIGENSVIGAGSVVTKDVPSNSVAAGNPCKVIRDLRP